MGLDDDLRKLGFVDMSQEKIHLSKAYVVVESEMHRFKRFHSDEKVIFTLEAIDGHYLIRAYIPNHSFGAKVLPKKEYI